jgi:hypothetical protein
LDIEVRDGDIPPVSLMIQQEGQKRRSAEKRLAEVRPAERRSARNS